MMRFLSLLLCLLPALLYAQDCPNPQKYQEKILAADSCILAGNFSLAYDNFSAAQIYCRDSAGVVEEAKAVLFRRINGLREDTERALNKANKLIGAFYFYKGRFALAHIGGLYFIDKNGDEVKKLGQWKRVEQFDYYGFAKVEDWGGVNYLLDTTGQTYRVAYRLADLQPTITALDLRELKLDSFPATILEHPQLEVLLLDGKYGNENNISTLPPGIQRLSSIRILSLRCCQMRSLPPEIGQLKNLNRLNLWGNQLQSLPPEIGQLTDMTELYLGGNQLTNLPSQIGRLTNLTKVDLSSNKIREIPRQLGNLQNLTILNLSNNKLTFFPTIFWDLTKLKELYLSDNLLNTMEYEVIKQSLPNCMIYLHDLPSKGQVKILENGY